MKKNTLLKIFVVDDDEFSRTLYQKHLLNLGFTDISIFENGTDCLNNLVQQPAIIFLDHEMDIINGVEVLKKIKRFDPNIFVVFLSGQDSIQTAVNSMKYGAFDYITKGSNDTSKIERALNKIQEVQELLSKNDRVF